MTNNKPRSKKSLKLIKGRSKKNIIKTKNNKLSKKGAGLMDNVNSLLGKATDKLNQMKEGVYKTADTLGKDLTKKINQTQGAIAEFAGSTGAKARYTDRVDQIQKDFEAVKKLKDQIPSTISELSPNQKKLLLDFLIILMTINKDYSTDKNKDNKDKAKNRPDIIKNLDVDAYQQSYRSDRDELTEGTRLSDEMIQDIVEMVIERLRSQPIVGDSSAISEITDEYLKGLVTDKEDIDNEEGTQILNNQNEPVTTLKLKQQLVSNPALVKQLKSKKVAKILLNEMEMDLEEGTPEKTLFDGINEVIGRQPEQSLQRGGETSITLSNRAFFKLIIQEYLQAMRKTETMSTFVQNLASNTVASGTNALFTGLKNMTQGLATTGTVAAKGTTIAATSAATGTAAGATAARETLGKLGSDIGAAGRAANQTFRERRSRAPIEEGEGREEGEE